MAWTASAMFSQWVKATMLDNAATGYTGLDADACKVALYDDDITPDKNAAVGSTGYATGQWVSAGNEVTSANWAAGGVALAGQTVTDLGGGIVRFDATDTTHASTVTLTNAFGCLVYDDAITAGTVADQGITYHYFGGGQTVTAGTFTIVWHANGLFRITV